MIALAPTLSGRADVASVLGMLASGGASGTFRAGSDGAWLRLSSGMIVACSGDVASVVRGMMSCGSFAFREVRGEPRGDLSVGVVWALLEAARMEDESAVGS